MESFEFVSLVEHVYHQLYCRELMVYKYVGGLKWLLDVGFVVLFFIDLLYNENILEDFQNENISRKIFKIK